MTAKARKRSGTPKAKARRARVPADGPDVLTSLKPDESAAFLRVLLERHPELRAEAEAVGKAAIAVVCADEIADEIEEAILGLDLDDLDARAGRHSWGYVEPGEAAWEILQEAIDPFMQDMKRHVDLGFEAAAVATCEGIVMGLYRVRGKEPDGILGYAEDFPGEAAANAVTALARESARRHRRRWTPSVSLLDAVPEWAAMVERCIRGK